MVAPESEAMAAGSKFPLRIANMRSSGESFIRPNCLVSPDCRMMRRTAEMESLKLGRGGENLSLLLLLLFWREPAELSQRDFGIFLMNVVSDSALCRLFFLLSKLSTGGLSFLPHLVVVVFFFFASNPCRREPHEHAQILQCQRKILLCRNECGGAESSREQHFLCNEAFVWKEQMMRVLSVARAGTCNDPTKRPSMLDIVRLLKKMKTEEGNGGGDTAVRRGERAQPGPPQGRLQGLLPRRDGPLHPPPSSHRQRPKRRLRPRWRRW